MTDMFNPVAVMDGDCALCCFGARMIHRLDTSGDIRIVTTDTALGQSLLQANGLSPLDPESWLLIEDGVALEGFDAMIRVGERSGGWGRGLSLLRLIPRPIRRWLYTRIARNRYAVFGRSKMCEIPDPALRARLLSGPSADEGFEQI